jgi:four helix bundle protein
MNAVKEKSFEFAIAVVRLYQSMQFNHEFVVSNQMLRAGTSIGANVEEALAGISKKDFVAKMSIASKEAREVHYWLRLIRATCDGAYDVSKLIADAEELIRILTAIVKTGQTRLSNH